MRVLCARGRVAASARTRTPARHLPRPRRRHAALPLVSGCTRHSRLLRSLLRHWHAARRKRESGWLSVACEDPPYSNPAGPLRNAMSMIGNQVGHDRRERSPGAPADARQELPHPFHLEEIEDAGRRATSRCCSACALSAMQMAGSMSLRSPRRTVKGFACARQRAWCRALYACPATVADTAAGSWQRALSRRAVRQSCSCAPPAQTSLLIRDRARDSSVVVAVAGLSRLVRHFLAAPEGTNSRRLRCTKDARHCKCRARVALHAGSAPD